MIYTYLGTPGAGKSLHVTKDIRDALRYGSLVVSNFPVDITRMKLHSDSRFVLLDNADLLPARAPDAIMKMCESYHTDTNGKRRILLVIDECQLLFDSRQWNAPGRSEWLAFFTLHRHVMGNDGKIILVTQNEKALDKRILPLAEYYVQHRNLKYGSTGEMLLSFLCGFNLFVAKTIWRPGREKIGITLFRGNKRLFTLYDTRMLFHSPAHGEEEHG